MPCHKWSPGKSAKTCPVLLLKIFRFRFEANHLPMAGVSFHKRGGSRSSRNAGRDAVDAGHVVAHFVCVDERRGYVRRSRVVLTPRRWRQVGDDVRSFRHHVGDGDKKARSPRRSRRKPLKPLRRECRAFSRCDRGDYLACFLHRTRDCGRAGRPAFPAPSDKLGGSYSQARA